MPSIWNSDGETLRTVSSVNWTALAITRMKVTVRRKSEAVRRQQISLNRPVGHRRHGDHEGRCQPHAGGGVDARGDSHERAQAEEAGQDHVVDQGCADHHQGILFHDSLFPPSDSPGFARRRKRGASSPLADRRRAPRRAIQQADRPDRWRRQAGWRGRRRTRIVQCTAPPAISERRQRQTIGDPCAALTRIRARDADDDALTDPEPSPLSCAAIEKRRGLVAVWPGCRCPCCALSGGGAASSRSTSARVAARSRRPLYSGRRGRYPRRYCRSDRSRIMVISFSFMVQAMRVRAGHLDLLAGTQIQQALDDDQETGHQKTSGRQNHHQHTHAPQAAAATP
jgi:hypothetical protein